MLYSIRELAFSLPARDSQQAGMIGVRAVWFLFVFCIERKKDKRNTYYE